MEILGIRRTNYLDFVQLGQGKRKPVCNRQPHGAASVDRWAQRSDPMTWTKPRVLTRVCSRGGLWKDRLFSGERGLNSRHVLIKKELRVLAASPPASLVSTQRPPSPPPQAGAQSSDYSTQIRTGDQGMRAWEEWVAGGLVGWRAERGGVQGGGGGGGGGLHAVRVEAVGGRCCPI